MMNSKIIWMSVIFVQATIAMIGSLYYGFYGDPVQNIMSGVFFPTNSGFEPCELCWYARILMYPLVIVSLISLIKKEFNLVDVIIPFSVLGIFLEIYHYTLQKTSFDAGFICTAAHPCAALQVNYFGFVTIPFLCLIAFVVILFSCLMIKYGSRKK